MENNVATALYTEHDTLPVMKKEQIVGAPVSCLILFPPDLLYYSQGSFLLQIRLTASCNKSNRYLIFPLGGTIHGMRLDARAPASTTSLTATLTAVVYGQCQVAFLQVGQGSSDCESSCTLQCFQRFDMSSSSTNHKILRLSDWIWDCHWCMNSDDSGYTLTVALAHNEIQLYDMDRNWTLHHKQTYHGSIRCLSYCTHIGGTFADHVAVGTITNEIIVWTINDSRQKEQRLKGHRGVLHCVKFNDTCTFIASTSDDRSVRLWSKENEDNTWDLKWTAWGHTARGWRVQFTPYGIVSTGEDGTARLWDLQTGESLLVLRGHACKCIWSVACLENFLVSGGNDGSIATYDLPQRLALELPLSSDNPGNQLEDRSFRKIVQIPSDWVEDQSLDRVEQTRQNKSQTLVGMQFLFQKEKESIVVLTRAGCSMRLNLRDDSWEVLHPWLPPEDSDVKSSIGCALQIHPHGNCMAIGTKRGDIILAPIAGETPERCNVVYRLLNFQHHRSVQRLKWINANLLLSFHTQTLIWIDLEQSMADCESVLSSNNVLRLKPKHHVLRPNTKGLTISHALNCKGSRLVVGDTRGNIALFDLSQMAETNELSPISILKHAHGREHVTEVVWLSDSKIMSVGNDGCIHESSIGTNGQLQCILSIPIKPYSGLSHLWNIQFRGVEETNLIVGGYLGNIFVVMDPYTGYEKFRFDTGGRQRSSHFVMRDHISTAEPSFMVAVCENIKDGTNALLLGSFQHDIRTKFRHNASATVGRRHLHGEVIFDVSVFKVNQERSVFAVLTGSEDCSSKISVFGPDLECAYVKQLPAQESGVRAVATSQAAGGTTLAVVAGSKLTIQFFVMSDTDLSGRGICARFLGNGKTSEVLCIDQRINTVSAIPVDNADDMGEHYVVTGDSAGLCHFFRVSEASSQTSKGKLVYASTRPILCSRIVAIDGAPILIFGTTGGQVIVKHLGWANEYADTSQSTVTYNAHSMGTNSISAIVKSNDKNVYFMRIISGGDDQALTFCEVRVEHEPFQRFSLSFSIDPITVPGASFSAIKGVHWINEEKLVASGYDQRVSMWQYTGKSLDCTSSVLSDIGDVNAMGFLKFREEDSVVVVAGAGAELISLKMH